MRAINGELDFTEGCMGRFEVSFLVFRTHALAQKLIDDGIVVVVPPLIEVPESEPLLSSVDIRASPSPICG